MSEGKSIPSRLFDEGSIRPRNDPLNRVPRGAKKMAEMEAGNAMPCRADGGSKATHIGHENNPGHGFLMECTTKGIKERRRQLNLGENESGNLQVFAGSLEHR